MGRLELNAVGTLDVRVPAPLAETVYGRLGDKIFFGLLIMLVMGLGMTTKDGKKMQQSLRN